MGGIASPGSPADRSLIAHCGGFRHLGKSSCPHLLLAIPKRISPLRPRGPHRSGPARTSPLWPRADLTALAPRTSPLWSRADLTALAPRTSTLPASPADLTLVRH